MPRYFDHRNVPVAWAPHGHHGGSGSPKTVAGRGRTAGSARSADAVRAAARLAKVAGSALDEAELTLSQYRVLVFLAPGGRPATHVAALLGVAPSTVTALVDGLVSRQLVDRCTDPEDRRRVVLSLTPRGIEVMSGGDAVVGAALDRLLGRLGTSEAEAALSGLELLNQAMELALEERFGPTDTSATEPG